MPTPLRDVVEVQIVGDVQEQTVRNVLFFEKSDQTVSAEEIAQSCATQFIVEMLPQLSTEYVFRQVEYRNLFDDSEAGTLDLIDQAGGIDSECLPPHDSLSIALLHDEPQIRQGRKSMAGIVETANVNGLVPVGTLSSFQASAFAWAVPALKDVATGLVDIAVPIIVKRIVEGTGITKKYRLPDNRLEALIGYVYQVIVKSYIRTQNSRKIGYGE